MSNEFELYCFAQSGNSYKVALMLELSGCDWQPRFVDFFNGETRSSAYRADVNAMGEAPVLKHCGELYTQSGLILDYLAEQTGKFGAKDKGQAREIMRWVLFDNHKFTSYLATYRFLKNWAPATKPDVLEFLQGRCVAAWKVLNAHLEGKSFVVGERMTIADISLCGYVFFENEIGVNWDDYPNIRAWMNRIKATPGWKHPYDLMPGHPLPTKP